MKTMSDTTKNVETKTTALTDDELNTISGGGYFSFFDKDEFEMDKVCPYCGKFISQSLFDQHTNQCSMRPKD